jgi:rsbT co-antagonist protein RsbR
VSRKAEGHVTNSTSSLAGLLAEKEEILGHWVGITGQRLRGRATQAELERDQAGLLDAIRNGLAAGSADADSEDFATARALLEELSYSRARKGFSPTETCAAVFALKDAVLTAVRKSGDDAGGSEAFQEFSRLVDHLGLFTFEVFTAARERIIAEQSEQLLELSTPVVSLWEGVVAVPLVGTLDSARTQVIMEKLLQALVDTGSDQAIIDITGVPAVDTQVAQHLLKTVVAARLMGAECIISGIRPQIAQTIVALGIEFGDIRTKSSLADALKLAIRARESGRRRPAAS